MHVVNMIIKFFTWFVCDSMEHRERGFGKRTIYYKSKHLACPHIAVSFGFGFSSRELILLPTDGRLGRG